MSKVISILIPTYNRLCALVVLLTSLCNQSYRDFDIIISNQGDEDILTNKLLISVIRLLQYHQHKVTIYDHKPSLGIAEQRDFLLGKSNSKYSLFLDDDLILESWVVNNLLETIVKNACGFVGQPVIGLSYAHDIRLHEQEVEFWDSKIRPETIRPYTAKWKRYKLHNAANMLHVQQKLSLRPEKPRAYKIAWIGGCIMYDSKKIRNVGGFSFWKYLPKEHVGEDVLIQIRLMKKYGGCGILPSGVYHQELPTTLTNRKINAPELLL